MKLALLNEESADKRNSSPMGNSCDELFDQACDQIANWKMDEAAETFRDLVGCFGDSDDVEDAAAVEVAQQALEMLQHRGDSRQFAREVAGLFSGRLIRFDSL